MKELTLKFLANIYGDPSSKRLAGLSGWVQFLLLSLAGAVVFLCRKENDAFLQTLAMVGGFSLTALGIAVAEYFVKRKEPEISPQPSTNSTNAN